MRCIHIYRGAPQLGGIKLHKHFSWFHTVKWGVHRIAPRTVLHVIRIVLTMELQPLKTVELHGWVCLPDSLVRNGSTSPIHTDYKRTHTHTHTRTHAHTQTHTHTYTHTHTHTHTQTHTHTHTHTRAHTHTHTHTHTNTHTHTHTQTNKHTTVLPKRTYKFFTDVRTYNFLRWESSIYWLNAVEWKSTLFGVTSTPN